MNLIFIFHFSTQLENDDVHTKLHKPSAKRTDTGKYKVHLKNDSGEDECEIDVIVLDKPGVPEGPLEVTETTKDTVSLQWKPPKDNGGAEITGKTRFQTIINLISTRITTTRNCIRICGRKTYRTN